MKKSVILLETIIITFVANCWWLAAVTRNLWLPAIAALLFVFINIFPAQKSNLPTQFKICNGGNYLLSDFIVSVVIGTVYHIVIAFLLIPSQWETFLYSFLIFLLVENIVFWNGIIRVYCTSVQLGIKKRVLGLVCGLIPILNIVMLCDILKTTTREISFERDKIETNAIRQTSEICKTKYPILLVHGVFFRDMTFPNYWGRIPNELKLNGAQIFYGNHDSAASVADSGKELATRIKEIVDETSCEKVNIIAHSKGGLDSRYAIYAAGAAPYVASLTTINTPHRGCLFADYLLKIAPQKLRDKIAATYNAAMRKLGDTSPDFMSAACDLTNENCKKLNEQLPDSDGVYYRSVGSVLKHASSGKFPLNFTYHLSKYFSGDNDGLVSANSFEWGEDYTMLTPKGKRGISHGDMIDLNRENIDGFDVREFYVKLVADLKDKGM